MNRNEIIGKRIRILREKAEMSQVELARLIGLTSSGIISQVENGERGLKGENLAKVAEIFGVEEIALTASKDLSWTSVKMVTEFTRLLRKKKKTAADENVLKIIEMTLQRYA